MKIQYLTRIYWNDDDDAYIAEIPALRGCIGHGKTMAEASKCLQEAFDLWMEMAREHNDPIPEPDRAREEISRFAPILSVAKLARLSHINQHTLASKLRRKTAFTEEESHAILKVLAV